MRLSGFMGSLPEDGDLRAEGGERRVVKGEYPPPAPPPAGDSAGGG